MVRPGVEAVLLDIDDTLVDTHASFRTGMAAVAADYLSHLGPSGPEAALRHWQADPGGYYARYVAGELDFLTQRRCRADTLHADLGAPPLDDDAFASWNQTYDGAFRSAWAPLPGAVELLAAIVAAGLPVGAVTNHQVAYQRDKLAVTGLDALGVVLVGTDTLGKGKPHASVFLHACGLLGVEPARVVYVGNDLAVDAEGALAAGLQAVWFDHDVDHRGAGATGPQVVPSAGVHVVGSLPELHGWLGLPGADLGTGLADR